MSHAPAELLAVEASLIAMHDEARLGAARKLARAERHLDAIERHRAAAERLLAEHAGLCALAEDAGREAVACAERRQAKTAQLAARAERLIGCEAAELRRTG